MEVLFKIKSIIGINIQIKSYYKGNVMSNSIKSDITKVKIRKAAEFGCNLAVDMADKLQAEKIPAIKWPEIFPITFKNILKIPEINKNIKIAKKVDEAAKVAWRDIREEAVSFESFLVMHPDLQNDTNEQDWSWRELFMDIEKAAGNLFLTNHPNEEIAQKKVMTLLKPGTLKKYMVEFEDDYKNFIDEIREYIRNKKKIAATIRLDLICMLNTNTKGALKLLQKKK